MDPQYRSPSDIHPCLTYDDAPAAIEWLCKVFGFETRLVVPGPNGTVRHSELSLGTGVVMVGSPRPEANRFGPRGGKGSVATLSVCVADPDAHHARAVAAGARVVSPLRDEEHGARGYGAEDLEGHQWYFSDYRPGAYWTNAAPGGAR
ncbi:MAG: VOC family protein [Planctomycetes bacterium]|nr:VOC family protein [Planctomycetota bacterium]